MQNRTKLKYHKMSSNERVNPLRSIRLNGTASTQQLIRESHPLGGKHYIIQHECAVPLRSKEESWYLVFVKSFLQESLPNFAIEANHL